MSDSFLRDFAVARVRVAPWLLVVGYILGSHPTPHSSVQRTIDSCLRSGQKAIARTPARNSDAAADADADAGSDAWSDASSDAGSDASASA